MPMNQRFFHRGILGSGLRRTQEYKTKDVPVGVVQPEPALRCHGPSNADLMLVLVQAVAIGIIASLFTRGYGAPEPPHPTALTAAPVAARKTVMTPDGPLVYYGWPTGDGPDAPSAANTTFHKRCGSNSVVCDTVNAVPDALACYTLIYNQGLKQDASEVPDCVSSMCLTVNGWQCCISWSVAVPGLQHRYLFNGASDSYRGCVVNRASGRTFDTNLNGVCLVQCLSNRAGGCQ